jgi:hypothetical protein
MKKLFLLVLTVILAFSLNAQKIGIKGGYGFSDYNANFYKADEEVMGSGFNGWTRWRIRP